MNKNRNIIIQAGGKGIRMYNNTWNRPKALIPILGKPILLHFLELFNKWNPIIVGDYKFEKIKISLKYIFNLKNYKCIKTSDEGSLAGLKKAFSQLGNDRPIILAWSDLFIFKKPNLSKINKKKLTIFVTDQFQCRYVVESNRIVLNKKNKNKNGIIGLFHIPSKKLVEKNFPTSGEFVEWIKNQNIQFVTKKINDVQELGDDGKLKLFREKFETTRFFNSIKFNKKKVLKKCIVKNFANLISYEKNWYKGVKKAIPDNIPKIFKSEKNQISMSKIFGNSPNKLNKNKEKVLIQILTTLKDLHNYKKITANADDIKLEYYNKTLDRVNKISRFIPFFKNPSIKINGLNCKNYFYKSNINDLKKLIENLYNIDYFHYIHGDPTFSNIIVENEKSIKFIDPRGYFGNSRIFGDARYDYSKLYYSLSGKYDNFNNKKFILKNFGSDIEFYILDNGWGNYLNIFNEIVNKELFDIKIIHGLIWLSLTSYSLDDYDAMLSAFYNGTFILNQIEN